MTNFIYHYYQGVLKTKKAMSLLTSLFLFY